MCSVSGSHRERKLFFGGKENTYLKERLFGNPKCVEMSFLLKLLHDFFGIPSPWVCSIGGALLVYSRSVFGGERGGGEGRGEGGGYGRTQSVHDRSCMTIDPRIPTMPGRSTSGFHQPGRHCLHQARSAAGCSASRMKGELHPSKNRLQDGLRHHVPTFLLIDDSANELYFVFWCGHSRDRNGYHYVGGRGGGGGEEGS